MPEMLSLVQELGRRIDDELRHCSCAFVPARRIQFCQEQASWTEAVSCFRSIRMDLEEARMCFLFGRFTACLFHIQRVLESGLRTLAKALNIETEANRSWDSILKKIDEEIRKPHHQQAPDLRTKAVFYSEAAAMFRAIKTAWRNPTMHVENFYDEEKAWDIVTAVRAFLTHLAAGLQE